VARVAKRMTSKVFPQGKRFEFIPTTRSSRVFGVMFRVGSTIWEFVIFVRFLWVCVRTNLCVWCLFLFQYCKFRRCVCACVQILPNTIDKEKRMEGLHSNAMKTANDRKEKLETIRLFSSTKQNADSINSEENLEHRRAKS
jgi:hypothetical protein